MTGGPGSAAGRVRGSFGRWRHTRPFWGGLLLLIAGIEMLLIPLGSVLFHGPIKIVIYIGIGGVSGILIGALLILCGLMLWFNPAHKTFYAILGVLLALVSFIATNLGGFFIGMLLGIVGGSLAFGWSPVSPGPADAPDPPEGETGRPPRSHRSGAPDDGMSLVLGVPPSAVSASPGGQHAR